jgi:hypothetical protein
MIRINSLTTGREFNWTLHKAQAAYSQLTARKTKEERINIQMRREGNRVRRRKKNERIGMCKA